MSFRSFLKQCLIQFFIITTCVNVASAITGPMLMPDVTLGFSAFYSPLIAGVLGTLPSIILYSKKELNFRQTIIRKILHLIVLEALITTFAWRNNNFSEGMDVVIFIITVFMIYIAVTLVSWILGNREAQQINEGIKNLQNRK